MEAICWGQRRVKFQVRRGMCQQKTVGRANSVPLEELQVIERGLGYELTQATKSLASAASLLKPGIFVRRIFVHCTFVCQL